MPFARLHHTTDQGSSGRKRYAVPSGIASDSGLPEFPDLPFREVIATPYRFFYRVKGDRVWVAATWHGAQLPDEPPDVVGV